MMPRVDIQSDYQSLRTYRIFPRPGRPTASDHSSARRAKLGTLGGPTAYDAAFAAVAKATGVQPVTDDAGILEVASAIVEPPVRQR
jgi:hypothetical protein